MESELVHMRAEYAKIQEALHTADKLAKKQDEKITKQHAKIKQQANTIRGVKSSYTKHKIQKEKQRERANLPGHTTPHVRSCITPGTKGHTPSFMAEVRFLKIACLLSNQKAALALSLSHKLFTGQAPSAQLGTSVSPSTIAEWNILLAEVDKAVLQDKLAQNPYNVHVWADDCNTREDERHMARVHTWCDATNGPVAYVLANIIASFTYNNCCVRQRQAPG